MRRGLLVGLVAVVAMAGAATAGPATPVPDGAPFVDAGLDQEVYLGDQVYLDGGGTWDDQGDITSTEWEIETPDGRTIRPDCPDCWFTHFFVNQTGQYNATLTVRDSAGHENSDTIYITTQELEPEMLPEPSEPAATGDSIGSSGSGETTEEEISSTCYVFSGQMTSFTVDCDSQFGNTAGTNLIAHWGSETATGTVLIASPGSRAIMDEDPQENNIQSTNTYNTENNERRDQSGNVGLSELEDGGNHQNNSGSGNSITPPGLGTCLAPCGGNS